MKSHSGTLCKLFLLAGFFYHGRLMSADGDYQTEASYATTLESTELPSMPSIGTTVVNTTVHGNETDMEEIDPSESLPFDLNTILICAVPGLILVLLLLLIFCIIRSKRRKKHEEVDPPKEEVKSPIFEDDTPSVMEIEMEDLDKWMSNIKKNNSRLSTLEEENKLSTSVES